MRTRRILYSSRFERALAALGGEYKEIIAQREEIFKEDCFDPRLKTHKLKGKWRGNWSFSLTYSHRVLFEFMEDGTVGFIDVGDHSIYQ